MRPSNGPDEVVVWAEPTVCSELKCGPGEEWALGEDDLLFAGKGVFRSIDYMLSFSAVVVVQLAADKLAGATHAVYSVALVVCVARPCTATDSRLVDVG